MPGVPGAPDFHRVSGVSGSGGPLADRSAWSPFDPEALVLSGGLRPQTSPLNLLAGLDLCELQPTCNAAVGNQIQIQGLQLSSG